MNMQKLPTADYHFEIPFYDLDPMHIVWHGNYIKYFEQARCRLLRSFNYDYPDMQQSGYLWPIVDMRLKYVHSAKFGQALNCQAKLVEYENRMKIEYLIHDRKTGKKITKGYSVQVAVCANTHEMQLVSPPILLHKLEQYWQ